MESHDLDDLRGTGEKPGDGMTAEQILAFAGLFAPGMKPGSHSADHAVQLFGADGMPE